MERERPVWEKLTITGRLKELRDRGWGLVAHNDHRGDEMLTVVWLFTKRDRCARGVGGSDEQALGRAEREVEAIEAEWARAGASAPDRQSAAISLCAVVLDEADGFVAASAAPEREELVRHAMRLRTLYHRICGSEGRG